MSSAFPDPQAEQRFNARRILTTSSIVSTEEAFAYAMNQQVCNGCGKAGMLGDPTMPTNTLMSRTCEVKFGGCGKLNVRVASQIFEEAMRTAKKQD